MDRQMVFVVCEYTSDSTDILGVYSSEEKAKEKMDAAVAANVGEFAYVNHYGMEKWEVDVGRVEG